MKRLVQVMAILGALTIGLLITAWQFAAGSLRTRHSTPAGGAHSPEAPSWKWRLLQIAALLVMLGIGGFLVAASGIVPIKASSGHWAITAWFLDFSKNRSVATHTLGMESPMLDEPRLILKGAGHYETACRACHGSPELKSPRVAGAMTPPPPYLPPRISRWEPEELFYIVKHGIKFTGMPAWPAQQRDDEVWAMTAFLLRYPELDAAEYLRLVRGEVRLGGDVAPIEELAGPEDVPSAITASCARCHGRQGLGRGLGAFPRLAGQSPAYLEAALIAYAEGRRHSGVMEPVAAGLDHQDLRELAVYFSELELPEPKPAGGDAASIERGKAIAHRGIPALRVPACIDCHNPRSGPRNPAYPVLAGQYAEYLVLQLELFKQGHRGGSAYAHLMRHVAAGLTAEQMADVARYYESLAGSAPALEHLAPPR